jgi:hypothetical protein
MRTYFVSMAVLFLLVFLPGADALEDPKTESDPIEAPSGSAPAKPGLPGVMTFESTLGNVLFSHKQHVKFGCKRCHHQIRAKELDTPHPDYLTSSRINCQDCHDSSSETAGNQYRCSDCHHSEPENISDETLSSKVVIHQSCWKCHKSGTGAKASKGCGKCHVKEEKPPEIPQEL